MEQSFEAEMFRLFLEPARVVRALFRAEVASKLRLTLHGTCRTKKTFCKKGQKCFFSHHLTKNNPTNFRVPTLKKQGAID